MSHDPTLKWLFPRSTNAFRTYGALGFFHGGATLQELVIPVVVASWPAKARKVNVVLKPLAHVTSETPRVQVQAAATGQLFNADVNLLARRVLAKIKDPATEKVVFKHAEPVVIEPEGAAVTIQLANRRTEAGTRVWNATGRRGSRCRRRGIAGSREELSLNSTSRNGNRDVERAFHTQTRQGDSS